MIQELESALSVSITIKTHSTATQVEADKALDKHRHLTLGKAVHLAEKEMLFPIPLQSDLNNFYQRRNWLIHQAMFESINNLSSDPGREELFPKIKTISNNAQKLKYAIEIDLISFCESMGRDMSKVLAAMEEHDKEGWGK